MNSLPDKIKSVAIIAGELVVELAGGRSVKQPLPLFPTLAAASLKARARWQLCGGGTGIEWPLLDYHLSAAGLLRGEPEAPGLRHARASAKYPDSKPESALALAEAPPPTAGSGNNSPTPKATTA